MNTCLLFNNVGLGGIASNHLLTLVNYTIRTVKGERSISPSVQTKKKKKKGRRSEHPEPYAHCIQILASDALSLDYLHVLETRDERALNPIVTRRKIEGRQGVRREL